MEVSLFRGGNFGALHFSALNFFKVSFRNSYYRAVLVSCNAGNLILLVLENVINFMDGEEVSNRQAAISVTFALEGKYGNRGINNSIKKEEKQCTYNLTSRSFRVKIVAFFTLSEKQHGFRKQFLT
jgi:hypothetical protein